MPSTTTTSSPVGATGGVPLPPPDQYDEVADAYERLIRPKYQPIAARVAAEAARTIDLRHAVVLELSAGTGNLTRLLAPRSAHYVATDLTPSMLAVARRVGEPVRRVSWLHADVEAVPLPGHLADLVVSCLGPVQDSDVALVEARRMLTPGGRLVACTWGDDYSELDLLQEVRRRLDVEPRPTSNATELATNVANAGFRDVVVTPFRLPVVHESPAAYRAYRSAFGAMPLPDGLTAEQVLATLTEVAGSYADQQGRVVLDWHLLLVTARS